MDKPKALDFLSILDTLPVALTSLAPDGTVLFVNETAASHLCAPRGAIVGRSVFPFFPGHAAAGRQRLQQTIACKKTQRFETVMTFPNGARKHFSSLYVPVIESDQVTAVHIVSLEAPPPPAKSSDELWDVVADELSLTPERLSAILETMPVNVAIHDIDGTVRYLNWVVEGIEMSDVLGTSPGLWLTDTGRRTCDDAFARVAATSAQVEFEAEGLSGRHWLCRLVPLVHRDEVRQVLGCTIEITELRRLEAELRRHQKLESLGTMASGIAHDFNNLLTVITTSVGLAQKWTETGRSPTSLLASAMTAARQAAGLCGQLLTYAGREQPTKAHVNLSDVISDMTPLIRAATNTAIDVRYRLAGALPQILGSESQLQQVVLNLVNNSTDAFAADAEAPAIDISTETVALAALEHGCLPAPPRPGEYVCLRIADNGEGISAEDVSRIFDPFYTTKDSGHGLGLSSVLGVVRAHGAAIRVETTPGSGTVVSVYFPLADACAVEPHAVKSTPAIGTGSGTLLVVDDEESLRAAASAVLCDSGFDVVEAADGDEALSKIKELADSLRGVLLDIKMPKRDGMSTLAELRTFRPNLPVVLSSGNLLSVPTEFQRDQHVRVLLKPYDPDRLLATVLDAIVTES